MANLSGASMALFHTIHPSRTETTASTSVNAALETRDVSFISRPLVVEHLVELSHDLNQVSLVPHHAFDVLVRIGMFV